MRIDSGTIGMDSARLSKSSKSFQRNVETHVSGEGSTGSQLTSTFGSFFLQEEYTEITGDLKFPTLTADEGQTDLVDYLDPNPIQNFFARLNSGKRINIDASIAKARDTASEFQKMHQKFIQDILELLFRRKPKDSCEADANALPNAEPREAGTEYQFVVESTTDTFCFETMEYTTFSAQGIVKTDDGREINVNIDIAMSSRLCQFTSETAINSYFQAIDPLVVNLHDAPAGLSDLKYFFDLDCDGTEEEISMLREGSGFLALDKNGDGKINDGSELFGTASGDGFKDLAEYDLDHNGWIDENDAIFEKLKIWTFDEEGKSVLYSLKEAGVGAIGLQNRDTDFMLNSFATGATNGFIRKTGIFLYESGDVGTVQHVDLVT
ncbi:MAG: hypothetical protein K5679_04635 [Lachnospiraceae bacterium]|nr:hypothetical protein [Lachnospiraceae bacterium]